MGSLFRIVETEWLIRREDFHSYRSSLKETLEAQFVSTKVCRQNNEHLYMCGAPPRGHLVFHYKRRPAKILAPHISCGSQDHKTVKKTYQPTTNQVPPNCHEACGPGSLGWPLVTSAQSLQQMDVSSDDLSANFSPPLSQGGCATNGCIPGDSHRFPPKLQKPVK